MRGSWPISPLGEFNDFDPPIDAEPHPEPTPDEIAFGNHVDRCAICSDGKMSECAALARLFGG